MRHHLNLSLYLSLFLLFSSCSRPSQEATRKDESGEGRKYAAVPSRTMDPNGSMPVGACKIVGTIVSVDSSRSRYELNDPCSKAPCFAVVRVDSVLACGSSFSRPIDSGTLVQAQFTYTLAPSKEYFPAVSPALPGLRTGSRFVALVESSAEASTLSIATYELRN